MGAAAELDWSPGELDITVTTGDLTQGATVTLSSDDPGWSPSSVVAQVRERRDRSSLLLLDLAPTLDGLVVTLPAGIEIDVPRGSWPWDMQVDGLTVLSGTFRVLGDVSEVSP